MNLVAMDYYLTEKEILVLQGKLSYDDWESVGMSLLEKGLVVMDPLAAATGGHTFTLSEKGAKIARVLRQ